MKIINKLIMLLILRITCFLNLGLKYKIDRYLIVYVIIIKRIYIKLQYMRVIIYTW